MDDDVAGIRNHRLDRSAAAQCDCSASVSRNLIVHLMRVPALVALASALLLALYLSSGALPVPARPFPAKVPAALPDATSPHLLLTAQQRQEAAEIGGFIVVPQSLLPISKPLHHGEFVWKDDDVQPGPVWIRVDLRTQILSVFRGAHEIGTTVVLYGADSKETPVGRFPIRWKGKDHRSSLYDAPMPFTLRLTGDGVAIHGSDVRWGAATHGCIGVPTEFARRLYAEIGVGDQVVIVRSSPRA